MTALAGSRHANPAGSREEDISWVADYVGLPWVRFGRDRGGIDCWGLIVLVYAERFDIALPLYADMSWNPDFGALGAEAGALRRSIGDLMVEQSAGWQRVPDDQRRLGDVLLIRQWGWPCHVGLFVPPGHVLHAEDKIDAACEPLDGARWRRMNRIVGTFRHERLA
jgi:cell wall-associated NlpC family hydrolase